MFIREQLIGSIYDLQPAFNNDGEMLDIYVNSPRTCRWQNWTFEPGPFRSPRLSAQQVQKLNNIWVNIRMFRSIKGRARAEELERGVPLYLAFCYGQIERADLPFAIRELINDLPDWATKGT